MIVKCWNCGTEMEKLGEEKFKASLTAVLERLAHIHHATGDIDKASAYEDVIYIVENFDE